MYDTSAKKRKLKIYILEKDCGRIMSTKKKLIIICMIIVIIVVVIGMVIKPKRDIKRADVKVPILLYHNFVRTVPESDPDNFNYINTPESFEENIKIFLENGYTIISMKEFSGLVEIGSHSKKHVFYDKRSVRELRDDVKASYEEIEKHLGKQDLKIFAYPYGAYTAETVRTLKNNGIDFQIYDIGMNHFKDLDKHAIKRINIPCEMTGKEIIEEIEAYK